MGFNLGDLNPVRILAGKGEIGKSGLGSTLATLALDAAFPELGALETAGIVGGSTALASGSIQKGLMAGLGAYGTSELTDAAGKGIANAAENKAALESFVNEAPAAAPSLSVGETASAGLSGLKAMPTMDMLKYGSMAAAPVLAAQKSGLPSNPTNPNAYIRPKVYDPATHRYYDLPAVKAGDWGSQSISDYVNSQVAPAAATATAKRGGLMAAYADGGIAGYATGGGDGAANPSPTDGSNSQLEFENEPAVRMARGGIARFADGGDAALAAYQAGNYAQAAQDISNSGMSAQDVVNKYGLSAADAATVAKNLGYTGDLSGLTYGTPTAAASTPAVSAAASTPSYNTFTTDQLNTFFSDPKNAAVLNTPGGLAAAETQYKADPNAVMSYLQGTGTSKLGLSAADVYQLGQGQGLQGVYAAGDQWVKDHPNATGAEIQAALKSGGWSDTDVKNYFNQSNSAYGTNLTTGKAFTGAGDIYNIGQGKGFSDITNNITGWIKDHPTATLADAQAAMSAAGLNELDVKRATGKTSAELFAKAKTDTSIQTGLSNNLTAPVPGTGNVTSTVLPTNSGTNAPVGTKNPYGNINNPGDITLNADGSKTVQPNIPGRPYGGFSGMDELTKAYTAGGGKLGQVLAPTQTYQNTGASKSAYDYLSGKGTWAGTQSQPNLPVKNTYSNPASPTAAEKMLYSKYRKVWINGALTDNPYYADPTATASTTTNNSSASSGQTLAANGGLMAMARGGMADGHLGGYSDGGRLLRGPGDGVSDSIPATIGGKQPARLADGEFVVPARIVSEIGNGSTEAGARKLYAMMDRVQKARGKTVGKGKVAKNTRADKYLPA